MDFVKRMKFSIKTLLYVKKVSYFGIAKLVELVKLAKIARTQLTKISGINEISENRENPVKRNEPNLTKMNQ